MTELLTLILMILSLICGVLMLLDGDATGIACFVLCGFCVAMLWRSYWETKRDVINECIKNNDLRGLIEYAYYLADIEIGISEGIKNKKYGKIHGWLLMRYCDYRLTKTVMTMFDHFNLSLDEIKEKVNQFRDEKISEVIDYDG